MAASEKQTVALVSLAASAGLAVSKLAAALATGSLGILSEAVHSFIDFGATLITWFAIRWGDQPPDAEHHYGHAKGESVAALAETGLLFLTTGWIVLEAVRRLWSGETHVELTWWAFAIIAASVVIDFNRSRALQRVADKTSSEALAADALHFSSDMWSSLVVLVGLAAAAAGLPWADAVAALAVSGFVALAGWRLGRRTLNTLLDTAPQGATDRIRGLVEASPGVLALKRLRLRPAGPTLFANILVEVARTLPADAVTALKDELTRRIRAAYPHADVTVAADLVALDDETVYDRVMLIAARQGLAIHHLVVQQIAGRLAVSFDLEVEGRLSLGNAHDMATRLETEIRGELGSDVEVESHIEPAPGPLAEGIDASDIDSKAVTAALCRLAGAEDRLSDLHNVRVRLSGAGLFVHYHCRFSPGDTIDTVHAAIDRIENALMAELPSIRRVIAHAEPAGAAPHPA